MTSVKILGTGHYAPEHTAKNEDFTAFLDTSDEWITTRTGMKVRHIAVDEPTWYMGAEAAKQALEASGTKPEEIDMVIVTTCTSDIITPSVAALIQRTLGIENAIAVDVNVACTGFAYAVDMARRYMAMGDVGKVLLVGAETLSQFVDYTDRSMCVLFGDGAGACVLTLAEGVFGTYQHNDIGGTHHIYAKRIRRATPFGAPSKEEEMDPFPMPLKENITMNGREVYKFASKAMPHAIEKACEKAGVQVNDLAMIFPHQANLRILQAAAKNMGMEMGRMYVNIHEYANTSSATIAIGLNECVRAGKIKRGDLICLVGFGAGLTSGAIVFEY